MHNTAAVARAQVAADPVVVELIIVGTGAEADTAGRRGRARKQRVASRSVVGDRVVMHGHAGVHSVRELSAGRRGGRDSEWNRIDSTRDVGGRELAHAHNDTARQRPVVGVDPVVGDLHVVVPAVQEDATAALRAVDDTEAVDARGIAAEVAGCMVKRVESGVSSVPVAI